MKNARTRAWLTSPDGLATRLRAARGERTVRQLADTLGWASSKVSRIETGQQMPTETEVDEWASATGTTDDVRRLWQDRLHELMSMRSTVRRRMPTSQADAQAPLHERESAATFIRSLQIATVPGLLQMPGYARELYLQVQDLFGAGGDISEAVTARMRRQTHLHDPSKRFEFIIGEAVLRYVPGRVDVMSAQLDRLISATDLPNVRLGIVPMLSPLRWIPGPSSFVVYDDEAFVEGYVEDRDYSGPPVTLLHKVMDRLWHDAVEGDAARSLILAAKAAMPHP